MSEVDEEVYTTIFNSLRHGVRRRILRMLSETQMTFTAINDKLNISSSHLTYHLDSLRELVSKNDASYRLSVFGKAAVDMMNGIENPPKEIGPIPVKDSFKLISGILLVALMALSALHVNLNNKYITQGDIFAQRNIEVASSAAEIEKLQVNDELYDLAMESASIHIVKSCTLFQRYSKNSDPPLDIRVVMLFYAPDDYMTLNVVTIFTRPEIFYFPLTLQRGNAFEGENAYIEHSKVVFGYNVSLWLSPVHWSMNVSSYNQMFDIELPTKGWYTLCLTGPVIVYSMDESAHARARVDEGSYDSEITWSGWGDYETWRDIEYYTISAICSLHKDGESALFATEVDLYRRASISAISLD
jgi:hypothetical protein